MLGDLDPFDFVLAETLHCTVEEMEERISNQEYLKWRAFFIYRNAISNLEPIGGESLV